MFLNMTQDLNGSVVLLVSAGVILILRKQAILFVDSRYTIQAKNETKNTTE